MKNIKFVVRVSHGMAVQPLHTCSELIGLPSR